MDKRREMSPHQGAREKMQHREENGGGVGKRDMAHARRFCCGAPRNPHPHRNLSIQISSFLFVYGHVYAIRDDAKERARGALHRKHVRTIGRRFRLRSRIGNGHLDQSESERVTTICAQRTSRGDVHVVPLRAQRELPITSANAPAPVPSPSPLLAFARQRSSVSASACVRAAGDPEARTGAKAMYGGDAASFVVTSELAPVAGMSHASGRPLALRQALSAQKAATTGGRRRPRGGRDFGVRRNGTRGSGER
jgi:hypothetical protein